MQRETDSEGNSLIYCLNHGCASNNPSSPVLGQTPALNDVIAERQRQKTAEGWTPEHDDDNHSNGELSDAASAYAYCAHGPKRPAPDAWPWDKSWWKQTNPRRDLVKAAALILAEIERLDRAAIAKATGESEC